ncbi:hypothetical protein, partial [Streptomyces sp. GbtcB6]|uniref:hypothetical protein n=1 Tax=Streptomyces sp. GbtcB6 TaxID=2824751 RepID=UPI001C30F25B
MKKQGCKSSAKQRAKLQNLYRDKARATINKASIVAGKERWLRERVVEQEMAEDRLIFTTANFLEFPYL